MSRYTWIYLLCPISGFLTFHYLYVTLSYRLGYCLINALIASYLPAYLNRSYLRGGMTIKSVQLSDIWKYGRIYFDAKIEIEEELDSKQSYIFCNFPHGAGKSPLTWNHLISISRICI